MLYIGDASGKQFLKRSYNPQSKDFEIRNLERHLEKARQNPKMYRYLDVTTAFIGGL